MSEDLGEVIAEALEGRMGNPLRIVYRDDDVEKTFVGVLQPPVEFTASFCLQDDGWYCLDIVNDDNGVLVQEGRTRVGGYGLIVRIETTRRKVLYQRR